MCLCVSRPKTAGTIGQMKRSQSASSVQVPADVRLVEGTTVVCNNEVG